ncbi:MAG: hypothetical protein ACR2KZ_16000, partial [Segetibacter sp.]
MNKRGNSLCLSLTTAAYSEVYVTDSSLDIQDVHFNKDTLDLVFSLKLSKTGYHLVIDNGPFSALIVSQNDRLHIPLLK